MNNKKIIATAITIYNSHLNNLIEENRGKLNRLPSLRTNTIFKTFERLNEIYPMESPGELWRIVEKAHVQSYLKSEADSVIQSVASDVKIDETIITDILTNEALISVFESAKQSWKRSSGIAWEQFFEETFAPSQNGDLEMKVAGPRDMSKLLKGGNLCRDNGEPIPLLIRNKNHEEFLNKVIQDSNFDLYLLYFSPPHKQWKLFGLIQCKTSIRERIFANANSSMEAMKRELWSILLAIDPENFFASGKYHDAAKDSWHGCYLLSQDSSADGTIFSNKLEILKELIYQHAKQALVTITDEPQQMNPQWRPNI